MSKKTENFYFSNFIESAAITCEAAVMLKTVLSEFDVKTLPEKLERIHEIEHKGDAKKHEMISELVHAFITPIERDDIMKLSQNIDDVTDAIEDILIHIYVTDVSVIRKDSLQFVDILIRCCTAMKRMLEEFQNFKKSKNLSQLVIEINRLEEEGDKMYIECMNRLHKETKDPLQVIAWREIYGYFENCCDACEDVADIVESITIGNS